MYARQDVDITGQIHVCKVFHKNKYDKSTLLNFFIRTRRFCFMICKRYGDIVTCVVVTLMQEFPTLL